MECFRQYTTPKGEIRCKLADDQVASLEKKVRALESRLETARDEFRKIIPRAKREEKLHFAMLDLLHQLKHINVTKGASVTDLRTRIEKSKKTIVNAMG